MGTYWKKKKANKQWNMTWMPFVVKKYWRACSTNLHYTSHGPDVHLVAVSLLAQHFRCNVVGCPTQRPVQTSHHRTMSYNTNTRLISDTEWNWIKPQGTTISKCILWTFCFTRLLALLLLLILLWLGTPGFPSGTKNPTNERKAMADAEARLAGEIWNRSLSICQRYVRRVSMFNIA